MFRDLFTRFRDQVTDGRQTVAVDADLAEFHRLVAIGTEVMGYEPPIWGGPGPFVRWRQPDTSLEITYDAGRVDLACFDTDSHEHDWVKGVEWGDGIHDPYPLWMAAGGHESLGGMTFPGGRVVFGWDQFEEALGILLASLVHDVPAMGDAMSLILCPRNEFERYV